MTAEDFLRLHEHEDFPHRDELCSAIRNGSFQLHSHPNPNCQPCSHFRGIYEIRAERIARTDTLHARSILADIQDFLAKIRVAAPDAPCGLWIFNLPPYFQVIVFEEMKAHRILGCFKLVDYQLAPKGLYKENWGKDPFSL